MVAAMLSLVETSKETNASASSSSRSSGRHFLLPRKVFFFFSSSLFLCLPSFSSFWRGRHKGVFNTREGREKKVSERLKSIRKAKKYPKRREEKKKREERREKRREERRRGGGGDGDAGEARNTQVREGYRVHEHRPGNDLNPTPPPPHTLLH